MSLYIPSPLNAVEGQPIVSPQKARQMGFTPLWGCSEHDKDWQQMLANTLRDLRGESPLAMRTTHVPHALIHSGPRAYEIWALPLKLPETQWVSNEEHFGFDSP